jgi:hypothetical protein
MSLRPVAVDGHGLEARWKHAKIDASVTGEVETEEGILVVRCIHVAMHLAVPEDI